MRFLLVLLLRPLFFLSVFNGAIFPQREKRNPPYNYATTTRAAEVYSVGFLKKGLDCVSGSAGNGHPSDA